MKKLSSLIFSALLCTTALPAFADASTDSQPQPEHKRHAPPPEAIEACKGLTEQDICQFNGRNNDLVSGICTTSRKAKTDETATLTCRAKHRNHDKSSSQDKPNS